MVVAVAAFINKVLWEQSHVDHGGCSVSIWLFVGRGGCSRMSKTRSRLHPVAPWGSRSFPLALGLRRVRKPFTDGTKTKRLPPRCWLPVALLRRCAEDAGARVSEPCFPP